MLAADLRLRVRLILGYTNDDDKQYGRIYSDKHHPEQLCDPHQRHILCEVLPSLWSRG